MNRYYFHIHCGGALGATGETDEEGPVYSCAGCNHPDGPLLTPEMLGDPEDEDRENIPTVFEFEGNEIVVCEMLLTANEWTRAVTYDLPQFMAERGYVQDDKLVKRITRKKGLDAVLEDIRSKRQKKDFEN